VNDPEFRLVPIRELKIHEQVDELRVQEILKSLKRTRVVEEPIWVDGQSWVILNGHHRFKALELLGAHAVPAWVFDYDDHRVRLHRWQPGPDISKEEVRQRGREGRPFPPKTTRHHIEHDLPVRPTPLSELGLPERRRSSRGSPPSR
jgi:hypothetical protein